MATMLYLIWIVLIWGIVIASGWVLSGYLLSVYTGKKSRLDRLLEPIEYAIYRIAGVDPKRQMVWKEYFVSILALDAINLLIVFIILTNQLYLPLNPQRFQDMQWDLALSTAIAFVTNTDLQHYAGETSLSYLSQMSLQFLQFTSAAIGLCVAVAIFRGFSGKFSGLGSSYYDFVRSITRVLLPLSLIAALVLVAAGSPQTIGGYAAASTIGGGNQTLEIGPVASLVSIMQIGTNGGGYFSANSASPYQNPTPFTNWFEVFLMLLLVTALPFLFGRMVGNVMEGCVLLIAMYAIYAMNMAIAFISAPQFGTGMEARLGAFASVFWTVTATSTMTGSVNASLTAFNPLVILAALMGMFTQGAPGGVGTGMVYMLMYAMITVFIVGLMVGRTPEYLGAKITGRDVKNAVIAFISHPLLILIPVALAFSVGAASAVGAGSGPAGFTQVLYEFASAAANNGSDFLGTSANTLFFNISTGMVMLLGRYIAIVVMLAIAGSMCRKDRGAESSLRTDNLLFAAILVVSIIILVVLTFFPFMVLGPILASLQGLNAI